MGWSDSISSIHNNISSNNFGGVNYFALNKDDGSRDRFISRFEGGKLVQFDYDAYHPILSVRW